MLFYFDASAVVKYYIREPGSTWVRSLINARSGENEGWTHEIFLADITVPEAAAAFSILYRVDRIGRSVRDSVYQRFIKDFRTRFDVIRSEQRDFFAAAAHTQQHPLKGYDAVQLAVAQRQADLLRNRSLSLTFVAGDRQLLTAAGAEGLTIANPFDHVSPHDSPNGTT